MVWTHFSDMYSGGGQKEKWDHIYIEAPKAEACVIFYNRFGHNPKRVSCTCCGDDYRIGESPTLEEGAEFDHAKADTLIIRANEIKSDERSGIVPEQGYIWH